MNFSKHITLTTGEKKESAVALNHDHIPLTYWFYIIPKRKYHISPRKR